MINCCVLGCQKSMRTDSSLTYFTLPSDQKRCALWLNAINRKDIMSSGHQMKTYRVCELHFEPDNIVIHFRRKRLKQDAVPTLEIPDLNDLNKEKQNAMSTLEIPDLNKETQTTNSLTVYSRLVPQLKVTQMEIISIDPEPSWNTTEDNIPSCNFLSLANIKPVFNDLTIDEYITLSPKDGELPCSPSSIEDIKPPRSILSIEDNEPTCRDLSTDLKEPAYCSFSTEVIQSPGGEHPIEDIKLPCSSFFIQNSPSGSHLSKTDIEPPCNTSPKENTDLSYKILSEDSKLTGETLSIDFKLSCGILSIDPNPKPICRIVAIESKPNCRFLTINAESTCSTLLEDSVSFCVSSDAAPVSPTNSESACRPLCIKSKPLSVDLETTCNNLSVQPKLWLSPLSINPKPTDNIVAIDPKPIGNLITMASSNISLTDPTTTSQNPENPSTTSQNSKSTPSTSQNSENTSTTSLNSKNTCREEVDSLSIPCQTSVVPVSKNKPKTRPRKKVLTKYIHENNNELLEEKPKRKVAKRS